MLRIAAKCTLSSAVARNSDMEHLKYKFFFFSIFDSTIIICEFFMNSHHSLDTYSPWSGMDIAQLVAAAGETALSSTRLDFGSCRVSFDR